jgi:hypothetical protein
MNILFMLISTADLMPELRAVNSNYIREREPERRVGVEFCHLGVPLMTFFGTELAHISIADRKWSLNQG